MSQTTVEIRPHSGPQTAFLATPADIAGYGGSAGGGKTFALLMEGLRHSLNPQFGGVIFRRTMEEVRQQGGLWDESAKLYTLVGAKPNEQMARWRFRSGAEVRFEHLQHETDKYQYQGGQFAFIGFDELTHFTRSMFFYMLTRNRSTCGVKPYVRATMNPDPNSWAKEFFGAWVDPEHEDPAESGELRWFVQDGASVLWVPEGTPYAKSVTFIKASIYDNPTLLAKDPGYLANLMAQDPVTRAQLLDGDWTVSQSGNMFRPDWWGWLDEDPLPGQIVAICRYWDLAKSKKKAGTDPDWSCGVLMARLASGNYVVLDVRRIRDVPAEVDKLIVATANADKARYSNVVTAIQEDKGSAGAFVTHSYAQKLVGHNFKGDPVSGQKADRAKPYSAAAGNRLVSLARGPWNSAFINEHSVFPIEGVHDDQVDAASGAFKEVSGREPIELTFL